MVVMTKNVEPLVSSPKKWKIGSMELPLSMRKSQLKGKFQLIRFIFAYNHTENNVVCFSTSPGFQLTLVLVSLQKCVASFQIIVTVFQLIYNFLVHGLPTPGGDHVGRNASPAGVGTTGMGGLPKHHTTTTNDVV
jgi:hypothetical protein